MKLWEKGLGRSHRYHHVEKASFESHCFCNGKMPLLTVIVTVMGKMLLLKVIVTVMGKCHC